MDQNVLERSISIGLNGGVLIVPGKPYVAAAGDSLGLLMVEQDAAFSVLTGNITYSDGSAINPADLGTVGPGPIQGLFTAVTVTSGAVIGYR